MSDNPLSGLSVPSIRDIVEQVVERMGASTIDLSVPLQRQRIKDHLEWALTNALHFEMESAIHAATDKAVTHVFRLMRDPAYQKRRQSRRKNAAAVRLARKEKREQSEKLARIELSRRRLATAKPEKELVQ